MPYQNEFAQYRSIRRIVENERVGKLLSRSIVKHSNEYEYPKPRLDAKNLKPSDWQPELILAIDGSHQEEKIENGYPGAEISYVTVASVLIDVAKMRRLDEKRPVDPKAFRSIQNVDSVDSAFPGCNVILDNEISAKASLRKALFETFAETRIPSDGDTLLETLEVIQSYRSSNERQDCPYADDCLGKDQKFIYRTGSYKCNCLYCRPLYSTDALRIHEGMLPDNTNGAMFAEIMQVLERVIVIHILRWMEKRDLLWLLRHTGIIVDGPLAIFGHPANLLTGIHKELTRINEIAKNHIGGQDILLVGVEKTGFFVDHFERIDENQNGNSGAFPIGHVALLTDDYIKRNIIYSNSTKQYGLDTYFGRKFFYKTKSGARIVGTTPFLKVDDHDLNRAEVDQFPRLADVLGLLEQVASSQYPNSIFPLISAHAEAAIPMNLGSRVLETLARKLINHDSHVQP